MNNNWYKKEKPLLGLTGLGGGVDGLSVVGAASKTYIEDVFSTYLYRGNDSSNTITTNIDSVDNDSLLWIKNRTTSVQHQLFDTVRGANKVLKSNTDDAQYDGTGFYNQTFTSTGFTLNNTYSNLNSNNNDFSSWTFRKAPGFFDVVTWTGNGGGNRAIDHNLGSVPGAIMLKRTDGAASWFVYHRSLSSDASKFLYLNSTNSVQDSDGVFGDTAPTSTQFTAGWESGNTNGHTYVAYVFAGGPSASTEHSVGFDGTGDYLQTSASSDYSFGTGDFTVEGWFNSTASSNMGLFQQAQSTGLNGAYAFTVYMLSGTIRYLQSGSDNDTGVTMPLNQWVHIAMVRSSGVVSVYLNGNKIHSESNTVDYNYTDMTVGGYTGTSYLLNGKISNFRVVKGTAVYTDSFIPQTKALENITGTVLLCCNKSTVTGTTVGTVTDYGNPIVSTDNPNFIDSKSFNFGEDGDKNVISCGSYVGTASNPGPKIYLGWEPQWLLIKNSTAGSQNWMLFDSMRGIATSGDDAWLEPDTPDTEDVNDFVDITSTGFQPKSSSALCNGSGNTMVYIAIRNTDGYVGKPVEAGTEVFLPINGNGWGTPPPGSNITNFVVDYMFQKNTSAGSAPGYTATRISGQKYVRMDHSATSATGSDYQWDSNTGMGSAFSHPAWHWRRCSGFQTISFIGDNIISARPHNLGGTPEFMLFKNMDAGHDWMCWHKDLNGGVNVGQYFMVGNSTNAAGTSSDPFGNIAPTATHVTVGNGSQANGNNELIIGMLFRSVSGISYVGSYIGNDSASGPSIDCGFQPRLIWIKNSSSTGNWLLYDSNRGFNKCYFTNTSDAEESATRLTVTSDGFDITSAASVINNNNDRFVFYAHA